MPTSWTPCKKLPNVGMGQAGEALAKLFGTFVTLSVPNVRVINVDQLVSALGTVIGRETVVAAVRQSFQCDISGEALVIYSQGHTGNLSDLMGYEDGDAPADQSAARELLFDVANVLTGACLCSVFAQLGRSLSFSRPSMVAEDIPLEQLLAPSALPWKVALFVEVNLSLEKRPFTAHILMLDARGVDSQNEAGARSINFSTSYERAAIALRFRRRSGRFWHFRRRSRTAGAGMEPLHAISQRA